jgi:hypothetical protein
MVYRNTADLARADRSHFVIDITPDYVTHVDRAGERRDIEVVQMWIDPDYQDAHHDPGAQALP